MKHLPIFQTARGCALLALATAILVFAAVRPAAAQQVYVAGGSGQFGTLNVTTGVFTGIGTGYTTYNGSNTTLSGVAYAANGNLYGLDYSERFFQINRTTGVLTLIGTTSAFVGSRGDFSIGNTSDGTIFAFNAATTTSGPDMYTINPTTGVATSLGNSGSTYFDGGIGGDGSGNLFTTGGSGGTQDFKVNRITGVATALAATTTAGTTYALGYTNSNLYAFNTSGGIYTINTTTGAATNTGMAFNTTTTGTLQGVAPLIFVPTPIPEPDTVALLSMGAVGAAAYAARRRRRE